MSFINAIQNQTTRTTNGMKARMTTQSKVMDLFYKIGASRGKNIIPDFIAEYVEDKELALRVALWARDAREGAGQRQLFRDILLHLEKHDPSSARLLTNKIPELGRFDDLLVFTTQSLKEHAFTILGDALRAGNGLAAKWCPRKGATAVEIRNFFGLTPKQYRKNLVALTKVVETQMCAQDWDNINFSHVPSQASRIYRKAFQRHSTTFAEYVAKLVSGDKSVKVNANAIYPHDVLKGVISSSSTYAVNVSTMTPTELDHITAQWAALPNYVGNANILPMVDVSGSMLASAGKDTTVTCLDVSISLGLYLADKNTGPFKDTFMTFSSTPVLTTLRGDILQKIGQMVKSQWTMNTNLHAAFDRILQVAKQGNVAQEDMPSMLLILSDMQFDSCSTFDNSAMEMIERKYNEAGYTAPQVVFWNLNSHDNVPVESHKSGAALVSGFSPSILTSILATDPSDFTPYGICLQTIMKDRYNL